MEAYMKDNFPFLSIQKPARSSLQKDFLKSVSSSQMIDWDFVMLLWNLPEREFQYLALDYLVLMKKKFQKKDLKNLKQLIVKKSWWDTVDLIASNLVAAICTTFPEMIDCDVLTWAESDNLWLRRTAILFQLKYKEATDTELLARIILKNNHSKEFFINKAVGWALREYLKTNREWVKTFIDKQPLQALSVREGSKYLD
ncbi:MAG: DNA alkylation repair protein [Bacillota bacterium]|nr:DNA alkylation repair protein [Bacillota bacterium]